MTIAVVAGFVIGRLPQVESGVEEFVWQVAVGPAPLASEQISWSERFEQAWRTTREIVGKVSLYVVIGIGVGAAIHGYVREDALADMLGRGIWWSLPAGVVWEVPMYSNAAGTTVTHSDVRCLRSLTVLHGHAKTQLMP